MLEQVQLNFSFQNKFIILLPCGLLVDNNIFSKMCISKDLLVTMIMVVMKTKINIFNSNRIKSNEGLMFIILNCTLLHDQNDGWTVPYHYLMVSCKNINLRMLLNL